jgi:hypothetical protein
MPWAGRGLTPKGGSISCALVGPFRPIRLGRMVEGPRNWSQNACKGVTPLTLFNPHQPSRQLSKHRAVIYATLLRSGLSLQQQVKHCLPADFPVWSCRCDSSTCLPPADSTRRRLYVLPVAAFCSLFLGSYPVTHLQYHTKLCDFLAKYDKAFLVHADNVGSQQFQDIRAVSTTRSHPSR